MAGSVVGGTVLLVVAIRPAAEAWGHEHTKADANDRHDDDDHDEDGETRELRHGIRTGSPLVGCRRQLATRHSQTQSCSCGRLAGFAYDRAIAGPMDDGIPAIERRLRAERGQRRS